MDRSLTAAWLIVARSRPWSSPHRIPAQSPTPSSRRADVPASVISSAPADFAIGDLEDLGPASSGRKSGEAVDTELIAASIKAREHRSFAGRLDRERLGLAE